jgi:predicted nucleic acid-binding protein
LPDAIIAASAIENELELVTLDKDLDNKPGLHIYPIELKT